MVVSLGRIIVFFFDTLTWVLPHWAPVLQWERKMYLYCMCLWPWHTGVHILNVIEWCKKAGGDGLTLIPTAMLPHLQAQFYPVIWLKQEDSLVSIILPDSFPFFLVFFYSLVLLTVQLMMPADPAIVHQRRSNKVCEIDLLCWRGSSCKFYLLLRLFVFFTFQVCFMWHTAVSDSPAEVLHHISNTTSLPCPLVHVLAFNDHVLCQPVSDSEQHVQLVEDNVGRVKLK